MTQVCSLPLSAADVNSTNSNKRLPTGIHILGAENTSAPREGGMSSAQATPASTHSVEAPSDMPSPNDATSAIQPSEDVATALPWGYIHIRHMSAATFEKQLATRNFKGDYKPNCFIHRTVRYKRNTTGKGIIKEQVPSVSGLVFLQGTTQQLKLFLMQNFPQYYLVNDCSTGLPASIPHNIMAPFMSIMNQAPERITFLRDPLIKFSKDHIRLRILTGPFAGHEGYVVRINRDRQLVMNFGGYAVAISGVHNEDFEVAE